MSCHHDVEAAAATGAGDGDFLPEPIRRVSIRPVNDDEDCGDVSEA